MAGASGLHAMLSQQSSMMSDSGTACADSDDDPGLSCPACPLPRESKKRYCEAHHSAFETIQRHACRPPLGQEQKVRKKLLQRKAKAKTKAKSGNLNPDESASSSSEMPMTDEHRGFVSIFGEGKENKGDQSRALRVRGTLPEGRKE